MLHTHHTQLLEMLPRQRASVGRLATSSADTAPGAAGAHTAVMEHGAPEPSQDGSFQQVLSQQMQWADVTPRSASWQLRQLYVTVLTEKGLWADSSHKLTCFKKRHIQISVDVAAEYSLLDTVAKTIGDGIAAMHIEIFAARSSGDRVDLFQASSGGRCLSPGAPGAAKAKRGYGLQRLALDRCNVTRVRVTFERLLFGETTRNNTRRGSLIPNKPQEHFRLFVQLTARTNHGRDVVLRTLQSLPLTVRAQIPPHFTQATSLWRASDPFECFTTKAVGIRYECPNERLVVGGNCVVTGELYQPSDRRVKTAVVPLDPSAELEALCKVELKKYELRPEWAEMVGRDTSVDEVGVVAQQVAQVWPEAVKRETERPRQLADGSTLEGLHVVKKERLLSAFAAALQELAARGDELRRRLQRAEDESVWLQRELGVV